MPPPGPLLLQSDADKYWPHGLFERNHDTCTCVWGQYNDTEVRLHYSPHSDSPI